MRALDPNWLTRPVSLTDVPIDGLAKLLRAIALPCDCERPGGEIDPEVCVGPPDRWERRWAESQ